MKVLACTTRIALLLLLVSLLVDNVEDITSTDHSTLIHSARMVDNLLRRWYMLITTVILVSCLGCSKVGIPNYFFVRNDNAIFFTFCFSVFVLCGAVYRYSGSTASRMWLWLSVVKSSRSQKVPLYVIKYPDKGKIEWLKSKRFWKPR